MSTVIYKYKLDNFVVEVPTGKVLLVAAQYPGDDMPTMWVEHERTLMSQMMEVVVRPTGETRAEFTGFMNHAGSAICANGNLVWHVFVRQAR